MKRVLLIANRYPASPDDSASPFVPHFVNALRERGIGVDVLTPDYGRRESARGTRVFRFATDADTPIGSWNPLLPQTWLRIFHFLQNGHRLGRKLCRSSNYDHIFALWALPSGFFARRLSREFGVPYSVWCLGSDIYVWGKRPILKAMTRRILQAATAVFGDGEDLCERVESEFGVSAGFLPSFRPLPGLPDLQPPEPTAAPRFLYLGRFHRSKGVIALTEAFAIARQGIPMARLQFVGSGPAEAEIRKTLGTAIDSEAASIITDATCEQVITALSECDCVVIPTASDSLPLVFSEAIQACRPVIGTDVGDLGRCIRRYKVGMVAASNDPLDLASVMSAMAPSMTFSLEGRRRLLADLEPDRAARLFCERALGYQPIADDYGKETPVDVPESSVPETGYGNL